MDKTYIEPHDQYPQYPLQDIQYRHQVSSSLFSPHYNADEYGQRESIATSEEFAGHQPLLQDQHGGLQVSEYSSPRYSTGPYYGPAPGRQPRRYKTIKRVALVGGNLVLDCPVPTKYLNSVPHRDDKEFTHMRYTAVTCDPSDFQKQNYTLRQALQGRQTELFIAVTMYNENEILFTRSMHGIMKNISYLCSRERSHTWGPNGWQKVVVCIVSDGRQKIHPRVLSVLAAMGVYQDGVAKNVVDGKPVTAHLYEYTTQVSVDSALKFKGADKDIVPVQIIFCLKEKNAKKINSHRWFFSSFGPILNPNICMLIDVGTRPGGASIYQLWKAFDKNKNIAGACGEIRALLGNRGINLLNPLVATQNFEYKISNILDKPLESVFGYISVLPGAFSAYRYTALQNGADGNGPLQKYFLGETQHGGDADIFTANMYLAEDRVLCFELVAKRNSRWVLHYVNSAYGETDVPDSIPELVSQRRRWLNGSFFAAIYAIAHFRQVFMTSHPLWRKLLLMIESIYQLYNLIFQWFALANFYLTFFILSEALITVSHPPFPPGIASLMHEILRYLYLMLISAQFIMAMGNRPQNSKWAYTAIMTFYALLMCYLLFCSFWLTYVGVEIALNNSPGEGLPKLIAIFSNGPFRDIILSLTATLFMYYIASFLFFDPWHMFTSLLQYLLLMPTYINVLNIYAFCNTHDVSWGTKGDTTVATDLGIVKEAKKSASGEKTVDVAVPTEQKDINSAYEEACLDLQKLVPDIVQHRDAKTKQEDYYKGFRTTFVISWMFSNAALIAIVTNTNILLLLGNFENRSNIYFSFVLWSVAGISAFRFCGSCIYTILGVFRNY